MCKKCVCRSTAPAQIGRLLIAFSGLTKNRSYCACDEELPAWPAVTRYTDLQFICAALVSSSSCCLNNFYALQVGGSWRNLQMSPVLDPLPDKENRLLNLFNEINASNLLSLKNFSKGGTCPFCRPPDIYKNKEAHIEMKESPHSEDGTKCSKLHPACRPGLTLKEGTWASEHLVLLSWHSEHRDRGNPASLSSPYTQLSFLGIKGPVTSGSLMPSRPPNPPRKERSLHLTNSAQRLQERDYRRCARSTPKKKYLPAHSLPPHTLLFGAAIPPHVS